MKMIGKSQTTVQRPLAYLLSWLDQIIVFAKDGKFDFGTKAEK